MLFLRISYGYLHILLRFTTTMKRYSRIPYAHEIWYSRKPIGYTGLINQWSTVGNGSEARKSCPKPKIVFERVLRAVFRFQEYENFLECILYSLGGVPQSYSIPTYIRMPRRYPILSWRHPWMYPIYLLVMCLE